MPVLISLEYKISTIDVTINRIRKGFPARRSLVHYSKPFRGFSHYGTFPCDRRQDPGYLTQPMFTGSQHGFA